MGGPKYQFTKEEEKYILENWGIKSAHYMKNKFGCSWQAVVNKAKELGLEEPKSSKDAYWTKEQDDYLKENAEKKSLKELATDLNRTVTAVRVRAKRLGVTIMKKWTQEEEKQLAELWGYHSKEFIAKKLDRSVNAIVVRATRLHLGAPMNNNLDFLTVSDIVRELNVHSDRIYITWKKHGLKFHKIKISKKKTVYGIKTDELLQFLEMHQDFFDARYLEPNIVFAPEPNWLIEKRKKDYKEPPKEYRVWSLEEQKTAIQLLLMGKNYAEIGKKINRTSRAVSARLHSLNYSYLLPCHWKSHEIRRLRENFELGFPENYEQLASELNKSMKAVREKCEKLGYTKRRIKE